MSKCLLYSDPELYDLLFPAADGSAAMLDPVRRERLVNSERFYVDEVLKGGGPALELGCGSGRLTIPIAQEGVEILGIDLSESMLGTARSKAQAAAVPVEFIQADMRRFDLGRKFSTVIIPGNSLLHLLTIDDLKQCLTAVRSHLAPSGRLIFDITNWDVQVLARDPKQRFPALRFIEETAQYDAAKQVRDIQWYVPDKQRIEYRLRVIFPQELALLLDAGGFQLQTRFGEFTREPFNSSSPRQVCLCA